MNCFTPIASALALTLAGCTSVVLPTVALLQAKSPLEADPEAIEMAVDMPDGARVPTDGAWFEVKAHNTILDESVSHKYTMQQRTSSDGRTLFRVHPDDLAGLRIIQAKVMKWERETPDESSGSFSVGVIACEFDGGPPPDATFSVAIRTEVDGTFIPLIRNTKVSKLIDALQAHPDFDPPEKLPACQ